MKILVSDTIPLSLHHRKALESLGYLTFYDDTPPFSDFATKLPQAECAVVGWSHVTRDLLAKSPNLKLLSLWSTGFDNIDLVAAQLHGVTVCHVPGYAANAIAEYVIGAIIALSRRMMAAHSHVIHGFYDWKQFCGSDISGKTLGIFGTGAVGGAVAAKAKALGMRVIATGRRPALADVEYVPFQTLLKQSDILTIHAALNAETAGIFDREAFHAMKPGSFLVNTARAEIVVQDALAQALASGHIAGAALDVMTNDLVADTHIFRTHENVLLTPHCAFHSTEALERKTSTCIANIERFQAARPQNIVPVN